MKCRNITWHCCGFRRMTIYKLPLDVLQANFGWVAQHLAQQPLKIQSCWYSVHNWWILQASGRGEAGGFVLNRWGGKEGRKGGPVWLEKDQCLHSALTSETECLNSELCKVIARMHCVIGLWLITTQVWRLNWWYHYWWVLTDTHSIKVSMLKCLSTTTWGAGGLF